jgi:hypothetical protein
MEFNLKWNYTGMNTLAERIRFFGQCDEAPALVMLDIIARLQAAVESLTAEKEAAEKKLRWNREKDYCDEQVGHYKQLLDKESELRITAEFSLAQAREEIERLKGVVVAAKQEIEACDTENAGLHLKCVGYLAQTIGAQAKLEAAEQREKGLREDAERWRAIIGCARIRTLGSAGIVTPNEHGYAHIGVELWTHYTASSNPEAIEWLTKFADISKAALAAASKEGP